MQIPPRANMREHNKGVIQILARKHHLDLADHIIHMYVCPDEIKIMKWEPNLIFPMCARHEFLFCFVYLRVCGCVCGRRYAPRFTSTQQQRHRTSILLEAAFTDEG